MNATKVIGKRILLVDDDVEFKRAMNDRASGYGVHLDAMSSTQLVNQLERIRLYDLVVLDYDLDAATGLEFAEFLQIHMPDKPLVLISPSMRPWQTVVNNTPNVRAVKSKWDGIDAILVTAITEATMNNA